MLAQAAIDQQKSQAKPDSSSGLASEEELMEHLAKLKRKEDKQAAKIQ